MKKILTLVLCWLLAFSAMAENTFKAYSSASVAGGYVTSLNKVDGSFEDGSTQWSASVGTIVPTASTEFQGNNIGVWAGTGAGTLDLQWIATSSNTYEASAQVDVQGEDDVYVCAYVGTTETGCKLIPALSKIQKVSVVADSVMSSAFYLRLKHTGSDAFSVKVDDGKIEPWTPQVIGTATSSVVQSWQDGTEWTSYTPTIQGATLSSGYAKAKRSGSNLLIDYYLNLTSTTASELRMYFPSWANATSHTNTIGLGSVNNNITASSFNGVPSIQAIISSGANYIQFGTTNTANNSLSALAGNYFGAGYVLSGQATIPIAGWSSTPTLLALPAATQTRYAIEASGNSGQALTANVTDIPFSTVSTSDNMTWDGSGYTNNTGLDVDLSIEGSVMYSSAPSSAKIYFYTGSPGSQSINKVAGVTVNNALNVFSGKIRLPSGHRLSIRCDSSLTLSNSSSQHTISITRLNGKNDGVFISNLNPDGFNRTTGTTGLIDNFSFSYGTTNATTVCSASPCSYLDQIGNYVTSVTRSSYGTYSASMAKTFSKLKCTLSAVTGITTNSSRVLACSNCSSINFDSWNSTSGTSADSYGTILCQGQ